MFMSSGTPIFVSLNIFLYDIYFPEGATWTAKLSDQSFFVGSLSLSVKVRRKCDISRWKNIGDDQDKPTCSSRKVPNNGRRIS